MDVRGTKRTLQVVALLAAIGLGAAWFFCESPTEPRANHDTVAKPPGSGPQVPVRKPRGDLKPPLDGKPKDGGNGQETVVDPSLDVSAQITSWQKVEDLPKQIAVLRTVFWDPRDTVSLRQRIRETPLVRDKAVLEIGTGSGVLSLCCLQAGASRVVATDVNPSAIANAGYNAQILGVRDRLELRLVPLDHPDAFSVVKPTERFDLIVSNPPWEDSEPVSIDDYAFYDSGFRLMRSLMEGLNQHLKPGGRALLAYGSVSAIKTLQQLASEHHVAVKILDDRSIDRLPAVFLPGMLLELVPQRQRTADE